MFNSGILGVPASIFEIVDDDAYSSTINTQIYTDFNHSVDGLSGTEKLLVVFVITTDYDNTTTATTSVKFNNISGTRKSNLSTTGSGDQRMRMESYIWDDSELPSEEGNYQLKVTYSGTHQNCAMHSMLITKVDQTTPVEFTDTTISNSPGSNLFDTSIASASSGDLLIMGAAATDSGVSAINFSWSQSLDAHTRLNDTTLETVTDLTSGYAISDGGTNLRYLAILTPVGSPEGILHIAHSINES